MYLVEERVGGGEGKGEEEERETRKGRKVRGRKELTEDKGRRGRWKGNWKERANEREGLK